MISATELNAIMDESDFTLTYWTKFIEKKLIEQAKLGKRFLDLDVQHGFIDDKFKVEQPRFFPAKFTDWQMCLESKLGNGLRLVLAEHEYTVRNDDPVENKKIHHGLHLQVNW